MPFCSLSLSGSFHALELRWECSKESFLKRPKQIFPFLSSSIFHLDIWFNETFFYLFKLSISSLLLFCNIFTNQLYMFHQKINSQFDFFGKNYCFLVSAQPSTFQRAIEYFSIFNLPIGHFKNTSSSVFSLFPSLSLLPHLDAWWESQK